MSKYTVEQVREARLRYATTMDRDAVILDMLDAYATTLSQQAEWPSDAADVMADAYVSAVNEFLGNMTESEWQADRRDKHAHLAKVARVGMRAALQSVRPPAGVVSDEDVGRSYDVFLRLVGTTAHIALSKLGPIQTNYAMRSALESYASRHARQVPDEQAHADGCARSAVMLSLERIVRHCDAPEKAAWSKYRGMDAIRHEAQHALKCLDAAAPPAPEKD